MKSRMKIDGTVVADEFAKVAEKDGIQAVLMASPHWLIQDHRFVIVEKVEYVDISFQFWCEVLCRDERDADALMKAGFRAMNKENSTDSLYGDGSAPYIYNKIVAIMRKVDKKRKVVAKVMTKLTSEEKQALKSVGTS